MIIVKLQGGLGNQMFQYAFGRSLSLRHNTPFKVDSSYLRTPNQSNRHYELGEFKLEVEETTQDEILKYCGVFQKIIDKIRPTNSKKIILEKSPAFKSEILEISDGYFDGFWQSEKYFEKQENKIRKDFELKKPFSQKTGEIAEKIKTSPNATSVHIRRGDYVSIKKIADTHGILPLSYYETSMKKIYDKFPNAHFFVSSDDIKWTKQNFPKNYPVTFVSEPKITNSEELILMSLCKNNIIANSTYSWWGAWLNKNIGKIVISPARWFIDEKRESPGLIPSGWQKI